jgi:hypothetical protein
MYAVAVVVLNALSFASLAYGCSAGGGSMAVWRGQRVADFGLALMVRRGTGRLLCDHGGPARAYGAFIRGSFAPG